MSSLPQRCNVPKSVKQKHLQHYPNRPVLIFSIFLLYITSLVLFFLLTKNVTLYHRHIVSSIDIKVTYQNLYFLLVQGSDAVS